VFDGPPGSFDICPTCDWEDDPAQLRWPDWAGGANHPSLVEAQRNFVRIGASDTSCTGRVRAVAHQDERDEGFRLVMDTDAFEPRGIKDAPYPTDATTLYYWRPTFWRRLSKG
jgi:hypothetical protein